MFSQYCDCEIFRIFSLKINDSYINLNYAAQHRRSHSNENLIPLYNPEGANVLLNELHSSVVLLQDLNT
jgi:hypothetical protein